MKVRRKAAARRGNPPRPSTGIFLLIGAGVLIVVAVIVVASGVLNPRPQAAAANDPTGLTACGSIPCPAKGEANAPVTMIEVSDYGCSHCRDYNLTTESKIEDQYIKTGKVRYIVHSFGFSPETQGVAAAALCAGDQGKFWEYHKTLFQNQGKWDPNSLSLYAQQVGIDVQAFAACVNSGKHVPDLNASSNAAQAAGVNATPSFFINGQMVSGALPFSCKPGALDCAQGDFQTRIEQALKVSK